MKNKSLIKEIIYFQNLIKSNITNSIILGQFSKRFNKLKYEKLSIKPPLIIVLKNKITTISIPKN